jgi:hypothetical protein
VEAAVPCRGDRGQIAVECEIDGFAGDALGLSFEHLLQGFRRSVRLPAVQPAALPLVPFAQRP